MEDFNENKEKQGEIFGKGGEEVRKKLFEIIEKFSKGTQTREDVNKLCEIIYYQTPYENKIVFPVDEKTLPVSAIKIVYENTAGLHSKYGIDIDHEKISPLEGKENIKDLSDLLNTLGHEYAHFGQDQISQANIDGKIVLSDKAKKVIGAKDTLINQDLLVEELGAKDCVVDGDYNYVAYYLYSQLHYEENARDCGFMFAKQFLDKLTEDKLCDEKLKIYLESCKESLEKAWDRECQHRQANDYKTARRIYEGTVDAVERGERIGETDDARRAILSAKAIREGNVEAYFKSQFASGRMAHVEIVKDVPIETLKKWAIDAALEGKSFDLARSYWFGDKTLEFTEKEVRAICEKLLSENKSKQVSEMIRRKIYFSKELKDPDWLLKNVDLKSIKELIVNGVEADELRPDFTNTFTVDDREIKFSKEEISDICKKWMSEKKLDLISRAIGNGIFSRRDSQEVKEFKSNVMTELKESDEFKDLKQWYLSCLSDNLSDEEVNALSDKDLSNFIQVDGFMNSMKEEKTEEQSKFAQKIRDQHKKREEAKSIEDVKTI